MGADRGNADRGNKRMANDPPIFTVKDSDEDRLNAINEHLQVLQKTGFDALLESSRLRFDDDAMNLLEKIELPKEELTEKLEVEEIRQKIMHTEDIGAVIHNNLHQQILE